MLQANGALYNTLHGPYVITRPHEAWLHRSKHVLLGRQVGVTLGSLQSRAHETFERSLALKTFVIRHMIALN